MDTRELSSTARDRRRVVIVLGLAPVVFGLGGFPGLSARQFTESDLQDLLINLPANTKKVVIPRGHYVLSKPLVINNSGLEVAAEPGTSMALKDRYDAIIYLHDCDSVSISGLELIADNASSSAVALVRCSSIKLSDIKVSNFSASGLHFSDSHDCTVSYCNFKNALVDRRWGMPKSTDIMIEGSNERIRIEKTIHESGGGYGVAIRTNKSGEVSRGHTIAGVAISKYNSYGIMLYRNGPYFSGDEQKVEGIAVTNNDISYISGGRPANFNRPERLDFGAGIYLQGAENCIVSNNTLKFTNQNTNTELLSPGAIGLANTGSCIIKDNVISNGEYGIYINDSLHKGNPLGAVEISGNKFSDIEKNPIKIVAKNNLHIHDNQYSRSPVPFINTSAGHTGQPVKNVELRSNIEIPGS